MVTSSLQIRSDIESAWVNGVDLYTYPRAPALKIHSSSWLKALEKVKDTAPSRRHMPVSSPYGWNNDAPSFSLSQSSDSLLSFIWANTRALIWSASPADMTINTSPGTKCSTRNFVTWEKSGTYWVSG